MSVNGDGSPADTKTVAVAVKGGGGVLGGKGSRRAVRWAVENLMPCADRFLLIHVIPTITSVPTPSGDCIPIEELDSNVVALYVQDKKAKLEDIFIPLKKLSKLQKIETLILEGDDPASVLLKYISDSGITCLVLGSSPYHWLTRKLKDNTVPSTVLQYAPKFCDIYVVSRSGVISNSANSFSTDDCRAYNTSGASAVSSFSQAPACEGSPNQSSSIREINPQKLENGISESGSVIGFSSQSSTYAEQSDVLNEVECLGSELQNIFAMYNLACEDLVLLQKEVQLLSSECLEEVGKVNATLEREETLRKIAAEERQKHLEAVKEVEIARNMLAQEACERKIAELKVLKVVLEKQKIVDELFSSDSRYRRYTKNEIEVATDFFSESNVIGEGAYGKVYKCNLEHMSVAVKVLQSDASDKKEEFLREIEVLSQLRHPHMVLLLGACPEIGCLVYEFMENGSLEDLIFYKKGKSPLPWSVRFRIVFEVACGLAFLHNSKPEPIVHRDLKPGNILLDQNYVSKIGDVGLAKLMSHVVPDSVTEYRDSVLAGTFYYMDPEYQRTGTLRPKSDIYALGIITLQLLTARHPSGLLFAVENAMASNSFIDILDKSISDWPVAETKELAELALKCSGLRCRDRPDLETEVLPVLRRLTDFADAKKQNFHAPSIYYCPILQELMEDPHIAADGFTYEHRAMKAWLERQDVSPVTKLKLQHKILTPNHTVRHAIQEWRSQVASSSSRS